MDRHTRLISGSDHQRLSICLTYTHTLTRVLSDTLAPAGCLLARLNERGALACH